MVYSPISMRFRPTMATFILVGLIGYPWVPTTAEDVTNREAKTVEGDARKTGETLMPPSPKSEDSGAKLTQGFQKTWPADFEPPKMPSSFGVSSGDPSSGPVSTNRYWDPPAPFAGKPNESPENSGLGPRDLVQGSRLKSSVRQTGTYSDRSGKAGSYSATGFPDDPGQMVVPRSGGYPESSGGSRASHAGSYPEGPRSSGDFAQAPVVRPEAYPEGSASPGWDGGFSGSSPAGSNPKLTPRLDDPYFSSRRSVGEREWQDSAFSGGYPPGYMPYDYRQSGGYASYQNGRMPRQESAPESNREFDVRSTDGFGGVDQSGAYGRQSRYSNRGLDEFAPLGPNSSPDGPQDRRSYSRRRSSWPLPFNFYQSAEGPSSYGRRDPLTNPDVEGYSGGLWW